MWTTGANQQAPKAPCMEIQLRRGPGCLALAHASLPVGLSPLCKVMKGNAASQHSFPCWNGNRQSDKYTNNNPYSLPPEQRYFWTNLTLKQLEQHLYVVSVYTHKHTKKKQTTDSSSCQRLPHKLPSNSRFRIVPPSLKRAPLAWNSEPDPGPTAKTGSIEATHKFQVGNVLWKSWKPGF